MCWVILQILIGGPILPELPPPPELRPPVERPQVIVQDRDTLSIEIAAGSPLGFRALVREDGELLAAKAGLTILRRNDHYCGFERNGALAAAGKIDNLLLMAAASLFDFTDTIQHGYCDLGIGSVWHSSNILAGLQADGFSSTMSGEKRQGGGVETKVYWNNPWAKFLVRAEARLFPEEWGGFAGVNTQHQIGPVLLTTSVQSYIVPQEEQSWGAGAGINLLTVFKDLSLELNAVYHEARPVITDTFLISPVNAAIGAGASIFHLTDNIVVGVGYHGVELAVFAEQGKANFWQASEDVPLLGEESFAHIGAEARVGLERGAFSNYGAMRVLLGGLETSWTPPWELSDSMSVHINRFGGFTVMEAGGERASGEVFDPPYLLLGVGFYYDYEPFRVVLRADDLLDLAPQRWPGLPGSGRRLSFEFLLFSTRW